VKIGVEDFKTSDTLNLLVKPRLNAVLSDFLVRLTGVTNEAIEARGLDFREAYGRFAAFADGGAICSFGRDDHVLEQNLALYGIRGAAPLPRHINIAPWLNKNGIVTKGRHARDIARLCGAVFEGREHDALEDSRSVALGIETLVARGIENPFR
jgi:inhibitor of KinA sporulation pathway (predicted exonuclease)